MLESLNDICDNCSDNCRYIDDRACLLAGDSLEILKKLPDCSISLILTDPPYHSTKKRTSMEIHFLEKIKSIFLG